MGVPCLKLLCVLILISCLLYKGNCECSVNEIKVSQRVTGARVLGKPQWRATVTNNCVCSQLSIYFDCDGYNSTEDVDDDILTLTPFGCLFINGRPLFRANPISFTYAWDKPFPFKAIESSTYCP